MSPRFVIAADQAPLRVAGEHVTRMLSLEDTNGAYELFVVDGLEDLGPPVHAHPWDEVFVVLAGELEIQAGDTRRIAVPGDVVSVPAGTPHAFRTLTASSRFIALASTDGAGRFFSDYDAELADDSPIERIAEVATAHEMTMYGPPLRVTA